ncbi:GxxExxY protein [Geothrix terrae]|uniref:GxxExxY protein n=1 Tax=Geothrix terrae TaxID=2922720 RepID=UPI001FAB62E9|nr:GxxExxY protein [Geothrix terrae]
MELDLLAEQVVGACIEVHRHLGPGLLESAYEECLCHEPRLRGIPFQRQVPLPVTYKSVRLDAGYRLDLVVDSRIILELKACDTVPRVARAQVISYLRLMGLTLGYLINFHAYRLTEGIQRIVLNHPD